MASRKAISPQLARELRRHVAPSSSSLKSKISPTRGRETVAATSLSSSQQKQQQQQRKKMTTTLMGVMGFTAAAASIPYWAMKWVGGSLTEREESLGSAGVRRGAFMNSGSQDVGRDPNWDFSTGTYRKDDKSYKDLFEKDDPRQTDHGEQYMRRQR